MGSVGRPFRETRDGRITLGDGDGSDWGRFQQGTSSAPTIIRQQDRAMNNGPNHRRASICVLHYIRWDYFPSIVTFNALNLCYELSLFTGYRIIQLYIS